MGTEPEMSLLPKSKLSAPVRSPISLGKEPATRPLDGSLISFTFDPMVLQVTPCQEAVQGAPDIQFALRVHFGPLVAGGDVEAREGRGILAWSIANTVIVEDSQYSNFDVADDDVFFC